MLSDESNAHNFLHENLIYLALPKARYKFHWYNNSQAKPYYYIMYRCRRPYTVKCTHTHIEQILTVSSCYETKKENKLRMMLEGPSGVVMARATNKHRAANISLS